MGQFAASGEPTCHLKRDGPFMLSLVRSTFSWTVIVTNIELRRGMADVSSLKMVAARYTTIHFIDGRDSSLPHAYDAELCPEVKILFK